MLTLTYKGEELRGETSHFFEWDNKKDNYSIVIKINTKKELSYFSCSCKHGSFYGQKKKGFEICRHIIRAYSEINKLTPTKAREILVKQKILNPSHLRRI